jgi:hypothetical protein
MSRLLHLCLSVLTLVGLVLAWRTGHERQVLLREYERLLGLVGDLPLTDRDKIQIQAIDTKEPLHFAWRVYLPAKTEIRATYGGGSSTSFNSDQREFIARFRIREHSDGSLRAYTKFAGSSSQSGLGDDSLARFLRGHWEQIQVEQLGAGKPAIVSPGNAALLLRLKLPHELNRRAADEVDARSLQSKLPVLFELHIHGKPRP